MHKVMEGKQGFDPEGYADAARALLPLSARAAAEAGVGAKSGKGGTKTNSNSGGGGKSSSSTSRPTSGSKMSSWQQQGSKQDWISLTRYLEREGLMPTVVFSFSKKVSVCIVLSLI